MEITEALLMLLVIGMVAIGTATWVGDISSAYNVSSSGTNFSYFDKTQNITSNFKGLSDALSLKNRTANIADTFAFYLGITYSLTIGFIGTLLSVPDLFADIITGLATAFNIPTPIVITFTVIILVVIVGAFYRIITKSRI